MLHAIDCPSCFRRYQLADSNLGKRVRCQQCGTTFHATVPSASDPLASLGDDDLARVPASSAPATYPPAAAQTRTAGISNPSGGPTDAKMRLGACGMLAFAVVFVVISLVMEALTGSVFLFILALVPLMAVMGITGLISPNTIRSIGQYGKHLPAYHKVIGWGLIGFSILLIFPMMIGFYIAGYRTDTPRARRRLPPANSAPTTSTLPSTTSAPAQRVKPATPRPKAAPERALAVDQAPTSVLRRKSYPVSIAIPSHSVAVPPNAKLLPGTRLAACWSGEWNPITTLSENEDGSINVRWDDFGDKFDCSMLRSELIIRKEVLQQPGQLSVNTSPATKSRPLPTNDPAIILSKSNPLKSYPVTIAVPADSQVVPATAKLPPGTRLQACWAAKWNPITLLSENDDGTLVVRWDDFGAAFDCTMIRDELIIKKNPGQ